VIELDRPLGWREVGAVAEGEPLHLSAATFERIGAARAIVESLVAQRIRAYGVNTGVGALCNVVVDTAKQRQLSRNIVMSHAVGVGPPLEAAATRAIIVAAINNYAHGYSGVRPVVVEALLDLLRENCLPEVPSGGSVGYLTHMAHVALVLIGAGFAQVRGARLGAADALRAIGRVPLELEAKEGLSLVNGTPCASGLSAIALQRMERALDWADCVAAMSFENLHGQAAVFDAESLALRTSAGLRGVGASLRQTLQGSAILAAHALERTQDPLCLRAIPQVHGAARDMFAFGAGIVDQELASVTDNPVVLGNRAAPRALSEAHAVGAGIGLAADSLGIALAEVVAMSERRLDRLVNPLVSRLPAFLAADSGACSGFMIAQYTAVALVAENRRLAAPASLDGGITSGLQEDHLSHATPAALKLLRIVDNAESILAIEMLAAAQAYELQPGTHARAPCTDHLYRWLRERTSTYRDDRPLAGDIESVRNVLRTERPPCLRSP
jgi:histidine ammonia-lyase